MRVRILKANTIRSAATEARQQRPIPSDSRSGFASSGYESKAAEKQFRQGLRKGLIKESPSAQKVQEESRWYKKNKNTALHDRHLITRLQRTRLKSTPSCTQRLFSSCPRHNFCIFKDVDLSRCLCSENGLEGLNEKPFNKNGIIMHAINQHVQTSSEPPCV